MDLKELRCFVAVAEQLSFTRAAKALYLSQPTLSLHIRALEEELGEPLFYRNRRSVFLTAAGASVLPAARLILETADSLPALAKAPTPMETPELLRVGFDATEDRDNIPILQNILQGLSGQFPALKYEIERLKHDQCFRRLQDGSLDVAVIVMESDDTAPPELLTIPLLRDRTVIAAANVGQATLPELMAEREFLLLSDSDVRGRVMLENKYMEYVRSLYPGTRFRPVPDATSLLLELRYGNTLSMLPASYLDRLGRNVFSAFPTELPDVVLTLIWNKYNLNPAIETMANTARSFLSPARMADAAG